MTLDIKQVETVFKAYQEEKECEEIRQEKQDNKSILNSQPFDENRARAQISKLIDKYGFEINTLAKRTGNGKTTTKQPMNKTPQDIWNDLAYIDNNLVLFALMRKGITSLTEEAMKGVISEMNHGRSI